MIISKYTCSCCGAEFDNYDTALNHENNHANTLDMLSADSTLSYTTDRQNHSHAEDSISPLKICHCYNYVINGEHKKVSAVYKLVDEKIIVE